MLAMFVYVDVRKYRPNDGRKNNNNNYDDNNSKEMDNGKKTHIRLANNEWESKKQKTN